MSVPSTWAILVALLGAGCATPAEVDAPPGPGLVPAASAEVHSGWLNGTLVRIETGSGYVDLGEGANCATFDDGAIDVVLKGNVTANWESTSPLTDQMEIVVTGEPNRRISGPSPLTLDLANHEPPEGTAGLKVLLQPHNPRAAVQVPYSLHWEFSYDGQPDLSYRDGGCGVG